MNILMPALHPVGGIRSFIRYVYGHSSFREFQFTLIAPGEDLSNYFSNYIPKSQFSVKSIAASSRDLYSAVREEASEGNFDLLHSHGLTAGAVGELARFGVHIPHLITVHDMFLPTTFNGLKGKLRWLGLNILLRRCEAIHAVGDDCAANFREYMPMVRGERVHAIRNGIDTDRFFNAVPIDARAELNLESSVFLVGYFGRFMGPKGFRTLIDAAEILVDSELPRDFRIVTFGWGGFIREDYEYLRSKRLDKYFIQCARTEVPERWMKSMDVIAMPSRWEACGLVAMESLVAGVPIVTSDCVGLKEVVRDSPALVAGIDDAVGFAAQIESLIQTDKKTMFQEFQRTAAKRFSVERTIEKLCDLYAKIGREAQ